MIGYVLYGCNALEKAVPFYDEILAVINAKRAFSTERIVTWTTGA